MYRKPSAFALLATLLPSVVNASECPTAATAKKGFVLLQADVQSEFQERHTPIVKIVNKYPARQTVFSYRGLIDLSRMDDVAPKAIFALSDLKDIFPLRKGARHKISFIPLTPDKAPETDWSFELTVTGRESFSLQDCKYKVWKVRQTTKKGDRTVDDWSALYSPDLEATLAIIYEEGTPNEYTVRYERIRPVRQ